MNPSEAPVLVVSGQQKLTLAHRQRIACIYIRQSSVQQVMRNRESQINQYQLVERATALGWSPERIRVIDADLGLSGKDSASRTGFTELVAEVSLGHVGIVFGYEVSRLARNNRDWYHLLDLAAVFGTLIADNDGIYDPRLYNDRLLLGLKGTMSEAELHLIRQRLDAGRLTQVRRNAYHQRLPTGLVRLSDGSVVKDPDDQVRHVLELVFAKFAEVGSCRQVVKYLRQEQILVPRRQRFGLHNGELVWKEPSQAAIYDIVQNPAYAGAFAYGRRQIDPARAKPGFRATGRIRRERCEWLHLAHDIYPAYISWEEYAANQTRLHENGTNFMTDGQVVRLAAREGPALLQGLVVCGLCGRHMEVDYRAVHRYDCTALPKQFGLAMCASLHGPSIDTVVVRAFFAALQPAQLNALDAILADQQAERGRVERHWQERRKRAEYEAHLARRQYDVVDPDNRLVAGELERRWEEKLRQVQQVEEEYERFQRTATPPSLTEDQRTLFSAISTTLPTLWDQGQVTTIQKKELLRSLIERVIVKRSAPDTVEVKVVWISGHFSLLTAQPPIWREADVTGYEQMVARIEVLWREGLEDPAIAERLTTEGFRTARALEVSAMSVQKIRLERQWYLSLHRGRNALELDGYLTPHGLAVRVGVERSWVYRRIYSGVIGPEYLTRHPQSNIYLIRDDAALIAQLQQMVTRGRWHPPERSSAAAEEPESTPNVG